MNRLDELQKAEDLAARAIVMAARTWRITTASGKPLWLKKLAAAVDAYDAAQNEWMTEYDRQKAEAIATERALRAFEDDGGLLDLRAERTAALVAEYMNQQVAAHAPGRRLQ